MKKKHIYNQIRDLIGEDKLQDALKGMKNLLEESSMLDSVIQQSARYSAIRNQIHLGTVNYETATLTENQIRIDLLALLREMETGETVPEIKKVANNPEVIQKAEKIYNITHIDEANFS